MFVSVCGFSITFGSVYCHIMSISLSIGDVLNKCYAFLLAGAMSVLSMLQCFQALLYAGALVCFNRIVRYCTFCCRKWGVGLFVIKGYRQIELGLSTQDTCCIHLHVQDLCGLLHLHKSVNCQCQCQSGLVIP